MPLLRNRTGLAGAVLLVSAPALLPHHAEPLLAFYQDALAFAFGLVAALPVLWPRRGESTPVPAMALGLFGLAAVLALQVALGRVTFVESSATGILYAAWAGLLVIAGARLRELHGTGATCAALQCGFAVGGFLLAVSGFVQFYRLTIGGMAILTVEAGQGMVGVVGQSNYLANIVACALASLVVLAAGRKISATVAALAGVPMIGALALSGSRAAWLFIAIIVVCAAFARQRRLLMFALAAAALFAAAIGAIAAGWLPLPLAGTATGLGKFAGSLTAPNVDVFRKTLALFGWHLFIAHPLLGAGWAEYTWNAFLLAPDIGIAPPVILDKHAHNLLLQLLAETGIAGVACIFAPLASWLWGNRTQKGRELAGTWIAMIAGVHLTQAMIELPHWYAYLLGPFALVLGIGAPGAAAVAFAGWMRAVPRVLFVAAIAVAAVRVTDYRALERWTVEALAAQRTGRPLSAELLQRLERLDATIFAPEVELIAAQIPTDGDVAARLALNTRGVHVFPLQSLVAERIELLRMTGNNTEADAIQRSIAAVWSAR